MMTYNTVVVLLGTGLLGASAGLVGCFAVLRRRALVGDALAHAALPGLCLAFLAAERIVAYSHARDLLVRYGISPDPRKLPVLLAGALATGLLGLGVVTLLRRATRIKEDTAIGIVLSVFFGAGIALSGWIQKTSPSAAKAGLDSYILGKTAGMIAADVVMIGVVAAFCLAAVLVLYKEFKLVAFDAEFARAQGWPARRLDLLLMALVALAVVIGLPAVGVVLMAAMLILPAVTARMWTDRLGVMLVVASSVGLATGVVGTLVSSRYGQMPAGPIIVLVGTTFFLVSAIVAPRRGVLAHAVAERRFARNLRRAALLTALDELAVELEDRDFTAADVARREGWSTAAVVHDLARLASDGVVEPSEHGRFRLSAPGRAEVASAARATRLWRRLVTDYPDVAAKVVELDLEELADDIPPDVAEALAERSTSSARAAGAATRHNALGGAHAAARGKS